MGQGREETRVKEERQEERMKIDRGRERERERGVEESREKR